MPRGDPARVGAELAAHGLMLTMKTISEDAKAILLLCGRFGGTSPEEPLDQRDYNQVVVWLVSKQLRPSDLMEPAHVLALAAGAGLHEKRLDALLKRGVQLGFALEQWSQAGIWVICRSDPDYPARFKAHLKDKAPPILFGAGDAALLSGGGLAIVGSRDVDAEGEAYAKDVAEWCARQGLRVVSGGARGVDQIAMAGALEAGGTSIGVLADSLLRRSVSRDARYALAEGRLLLISPYNPEAGFNVGNAMGRNKLIYALADYGLVISADLKKGGTWEGATEELKRNPRRPVFIRMTGTVPKGNGKLVELGGIPFPAFRGSADAAGLLARTAAASAAAERESDLPLFEQTKSTRTPAVARETPPPVEQKKAEPPVSAPAQPATIYEAVLPLILAALAKPASANDLAKQLDVSKAQLAAWLKRALADKTVVKRGRPVKYAKGPGAAP